MVESRILVAYTENGISADDRSVSEAEAALALVYEPGYLTLYGIQAKSASRADVYF